MYLYVDRQGCVIRTVAYSLRTDRQTDSTGTDKSLKTEGPKILSTDVFYFRSVIIGGPILKIIKADGCVSRCLYKLWSDIRVTRWPMSG